MECISPPVGSNHGNSSPRPRSCAGCDTDFTSADQLIVKALDCFWHASCIRCTDCDTCLDSKCYVRDQRVLCAKDFFRRYGPKCMACDKEIPPTEMIYKISSSAYHMSCLQCIECKCQLATGDEFFRLDDGKIICKADYEDNDDIESAKAKRARTFISNDQLSALKLSYYTTSKPSLRERERIAKETGLDMRVVQVWFQNRRAKDKRLRTKGQFPWLLNSHHRPRVRSHTWSPGSATLPQIRFSADNELEYDLNELKSIKDDMATRSAIQIPLSVFRSDSPQSYTSESTAEGSSLSPHISTADISMQLQKAQFDQAVFSLPSTIPLFQHDNNLQGGVAFSNTINLADVRTAAAPKVPNQVSELPLWLNSLPLSSTAPVVGSAAAAPSVIRMMPALEPTGRLRMFQNLQNSFLPTTSLGDQ